VAAVARQQGTGGRHQRGPDDGQRDDEVQGRRGVPERVREVVPEQVLQLVHERQEPGGEDGRGNPDQRAEQYEAEVLAPGWHPRTLCRGSSGSPTR
jgi:hypothetical protein